MFALIRRWIRERRSPVLVVDETTDLDELATRVYDRLQELQEAKKPLRALFDLAENEAQRQLMELRDALPNRQRLVLYEHIENGLNYKQIAQKYGVTYRIVLRDLARAYATLRMRIRA